MQNHLNRILNIAYFMIMLNATIQATSLGDWAIGILLMAIIYFAGNRVSELIKKIDSVWDHVTKQEQQNMAMKSDIEETQQDLKKLELDLNVKFDRMDKKLDSFMQEVRRDITN